MNPGEFLHNSDVTVAEIYDLQRKLRKLFPEGHLFRSSMIGFGAGPRKRQKPKQKERAAK
jgi:hypothetical protein